MEVLDKKIIFVGGKGGVGKSTSAAGIAWRAAEKGYKTLLISTDPAHNLGDIFDQSIGGKTTKVSDNLSALEIDPDIETEKYINSVKENMKGTVHSGMMEEVHRQLDTAKASPGADEAALFDKLISIILEESEHFDKLVFDTAPTGHTIRLLTLPELMGVWIEGLLKKRKKTKENYSQLLNDGEPIEDPIYDVLRERQERFSKAREILLDGNKTGFIFVLNPERLPILETKKALELLDNYHLHVKTLIVNKVLPDNADGQFLQELKENEKGYLSKIKETFKKQEIVYIPLFSHDISSKEELMQFSKYYR
ncbi:arsenic-transporting ATPase [Salipaludibacillus keqinensis]|uniref:Arsenic-transporting ATPase n=1 Tax=Salipaludibacillus keqinensis TaxID=2045207 RepID=A0A323TIG2_9BACI|nr:ArsA family ATPase [Salipaludibacillus keqinensis]PYZ93357.1 arsenic-transporting ATPase [Salipaludibacillus keqinensis]